MAFIISPAELTTPLGAVNKMLSSLGEAPIATINPPPTSDAEEALGRLNEADLDVQSEGWAWNREHDFPLSLAGDGTIPLPAMTLRMTPSASTVGTWDVIDRGGKLYDRKNHTFTFTGQTPPKVDLIVRLDWDSLPQAARAYLVYLATQRFHAGKQGAAVVLNVNSADVLRARTTLLQYDDEVAQENAINGNAGAVTALYGVGGMRRNRGGL